jgi:hypothetical protein
MIDALPSIHSARYRVEALIGRGTSSVVYRAHDCELGLDVALKTIPAPGAQGAYELKREFRELADVQHLHLVELYELSVEAGQCFFTMELVEGPPVAEWVGDGRGGLSVPRLIGVARQLADGLAALHRAGQLHRDVKPSNVGIAADGRALLLDFGLATALDAATHARVAGTPSHMAPEQFWGWAPGPAADWYALGSLLFELAAGRPPFAGDPARLAGDKTTHPAPPLAALAPGLPPELTALVDALLERRADARPTGTEVSARLEALAGDSPGPPPAPVLAPDVFVGRTAELEILARAQQRAGDGTLAAVRLAGPSGIGKTTLVHRFLAQAAPAAEALAVRGRCHPHEHLPFNAFDRVVDELSALLAERHRDVPLPADMACLRRLFPTLARVPDPPDAPGRPPPTDPVEVRRRGFAAFRDLLRTLATRMPVFVWLDDLQWCDADSASLLAELLRTPDAPAMCVVASYRDDVEEPLPDAATSALRAAETIRLGPLNDAETTMLLRARHGALADDAVVHRLARLADGSPFVALQLAAHLPAATIADDVDLGRLLADRFDRLSAPARRLLELAAVAGRPLDLRVALEAGELQPAERLTLRALERDGLVRRARVGHAPSFEPSHDRIREAFLAVLDPATRRARHGALAVVLERREHPDPEEIFAHFLAADDAHGAHRHGERAGDRATAATAFDRAARLYRQTLGLGIAAAERLRVLEKLGNTLTNAGRCGEAGLAFDDAAREAARHDPDPAHRLHLRYRHALEYLRGGHWHEAQAALGDLLNALDLAIPSSQSRAVLRLIAQRTRLLMRRWRLRPARHVPDARRSQRLDILWRTGRTLSMFDPVLADLLVVRHCLEALDAHDPAHVALALATEAAKSAQIGGSFLRRRSRRMLALADELVAGLGDAEAHTGVLFGHIVTAYEEGRWRACHEAAARIIDVYLTGSVGVSWELSTADAYRLTTLAHMGRFSEAGGSLPMVIAAAEERGDRYAAIGLRSSALSLVWLAGDRPDALVRELDGAMAPWASGAEFQIQHYLYLIAAVQAALYRGDGDDAWRRLEAAWPGARRAQFLRLETPAIELRGLRARAALRRAADTSPTERRRLLRFVRQEARRIARARVAWAPAAATMLWAGCDAWDAPARAPRRYLDAARLHEHADMAAHAAADRLVAAWLGDGPIVAAEGAAARRALEAAGVERPDALAAALTGMSLSAR